MQLTWSCFRLAFILVLLLLSLLRASPHFTAVIITTYHHLYLATYTLKYMLYEILNINCKLQWISGKVRREGPNTSGREEKTYASV